MVRWADGGGEGKTGSGSKRWLLISRAEPAKAHCQSPIFLSVVVCYCTRIAFVVVVWCEIPIVEGWAALARSAPVPCSQY